MRVVTNFGDGDSETDQILCTGPYESARGAARVI